MRDEEVDTNHALLAENTIDRQRWPAREWCSSPHLALLVASPATVGLDLRFELVNAVAERRIVGPEPERPSQ
jgi:hypothetical protein